MGNSLLFSKISSLGKSVSGKSIWHMLIHYEHTQVD